MANNIVLYISCVFAMFHTPAGLSDCCNVVTIGTVSKVKCSGCRLQTVPQDLPVHVSVLNLYSNNLTVLHKDSFRYLHQLDSLILSSNHLTRISSGAFDGLTNLTDLDLSNNLLDKSSFDLFVFQPLKSLKRLNLKNNRFYLTKSYPEHVFPYLSQMETLEIDIFEGFCFGTSFSNLTRLQNIFFFSFKERISILNSTFVGLERANISHLQLESPIRRFEINALSPLRHLTSYIFDSVRTMNIREVMKTLYGLQNRKMELLALKGNYISSTDSISLVKSDFIYLSTMCVRKLAFPRNDIRNIGAGALLSWPNRKCTEILDISTNSIKTVRILYYVLLFPSITHLYASFQTSKNSKKRSPAIDVNTKLVLPPSLIYINVSHLPINGLLPNVTIHENNSLKVLDGSYPLWGPWCAYGRVKGLINLAALYMSGFDCLQYNPEMFADMPNLSVLEAKQCNLGHLFDKDANVLFKGRYNLNVLDLSANNIKTLRPNIFADQKNSMKKLHLASNKLVSLHMHVVMEFQRLEEFDVSHNLISSLTTSEMSFLDTYRTKSSKFKVNLFGNPLVCSCEALDFLDWVGTTNVLYQRGDLSCITPEGSQMKIMTFLQTLDKFQISCGSQIWLITSLILMGVFVFSVFLSKMAWKHSVKLKVWCRQPLENEVFPFDVFISYCREDATWVTSTLVPMLEQESIDYCIDEKDFDLGVDVCDNIMNAIDNSRKSVFVVSCNYFKDEWQTFTMKLTSVYSFRDGRENMNVIVLLNNLRQSEFPKLIRKNWDAINPILWPVESSYDENRLATARKLFWKKFLKRIKKQNSQLVENSRSNSSV